MNEPQEHWVFRSFLRPSYDILSKTAALPAESVIVLHLWALPSFEDSQSWIVYYKHLMYASRRKDPISIPLVKEIQWDYETSGDNIEATLKSVREVSLQQEPFLNLLDQGRKISVSLIDIPYPMGNDVTLFGMEMHRWGFGSFRLTWSHRGPNEWQEITAWYHTMRQFLIEALDRAQEPGG